MDSLCVKTWSTNGDGGIAYLLWLKVFPFSLKNLNSMEEKITVAESLLYKTFYRYSKWEGSSDANM